MLAAGWYSVGSALLTGPAADVLPIAGAIALASLTPSIILNRAAKRRFTDARLSAAQRLDAFNKHACINIVNHRDQLTEVNDKLLELTGYTREELIGRSIKILYPPSAQDVAVDIRRHLLRGENWEGETPLWHKDGRTIYTQSTIIPLFEADGSWAGSISARTDVTRTNELIAERHTAQTLYELRDDIWIIDAENEQFTYLNRAAKERLNWTSLPSSAGDSDDSKCPHDVNEILAACRSMDQNRGASHQFETVFMGVPVNVSIKFLPNLNNTGRYLILLNDISARIEQDLRKSAFISTVSHELRSPLTSIKGAMGLLLSKSAGELPDRALTLLEIAHRNADRLILIINDMLDIEKIASGEMSFDIQDVDMAELIVETDQASALLQQRFGIHVELIGMDRSVLFRTDPNRIIQVLTNLLSNAYKFSKPNGKITIKLEEKVDHVRVSVQDEGKGIPEDEQFKIFDRFADMINSDRAAKGGTGLGLSICKEIVESFGGTIGFDTQEGIGTAFFFCLPRSLPDHLLTDNVFEKISA